MELGAAIFGLFLLFLNSNKCCGANFVFNVVWHGLFCCCYFWLFVLQLSSICRWEKRSWFDFRKFFFLRVYLKHGLDLGVCYVKERRKKENHYQEAPTFVTRSPSPFSFFLYIFFSSLFLSFPFFFTFLVEISSTCPTIR